MAKRYIPRSPFTVRDKRGIKRSFNPDRKGRDGTLGYSEDEVANLYADHLKSFRVETVAGDTVLEDEVVEVATSAPGEKRTAKTKATE